MRALIQRVKSAQVIVDEQTVGKIEQGLLVFLGLHQNDHVGQLPWMIEKLIHLRLFTDEAGKMNLSVQDVQGKILVVSQFTLYGDCRTGRRPSFTQTMPPQDAEGLYEQFVSKLKEAIGESQVETGTFGAYMQVELVNDGPVTFLIEN